MSNDSPSSSFSEWQLVDRHPSLTRSDRTLLSLFESFPIDSGWTVLQPPLTAITSNEEFDLAVKKAGFIENLSRNSIAQLIRNSGIPNNRRAQVWKLLLERERLGGALTGFALPRMNLPKFCEKVTIADEIKEQIAKDVARTRPESDCKSFQENLTKVLENYASLRPLVGYCQGMSYVAAVFLQSGFTVEMAFSGFCAFCDEVATDFYIPSLGGLHDAVNDLERFLKREYPEITRNLKRLGLPLLWVTAEPFLCIFSRTFPLFAIFRFWDMIMLQGKRGVIAVMAALLIMSRNVFESESNEPDDSPSMNHLQAFQRKTQTLASSNVEQVVHMAFSVIDRDCL